MFASLSIALWGVGVCSSWAEDAAQPWEFAVEGGHFHDSVDVAGGTAEHEHFSLNHPFVWADLGYAPSAYFRVGLEGGIIPSARDTENVQGYNVLAQPFSGTHSAATSADYAGLFGQAEKAIAERYHAYFRFGVGVFSGHASVDFAGTVAPGITTHSHADTDSLDPALTFAIGGDYDLTKNISLGIGVRDLMPMFLSTGTQFDDNGTFAGFYDAVQTHHYWMPFGRVAYHFGGQ